MANTVYIPPKNSTAAPDPIGQQAAAATAQAPLNDTNDFWTDDTWATQAGTLGGSANYAPSQAATAQSRGDAFQNQMYGAATGEAQRGNATQEQLNALGGAASSRADDFQNMLYNQGQAATGLGQQYAGNVQGAGAGANALGNSALGQANEFAQWQANQANSLMNQGANAANRAPIQGSFGAQGDALNIAQQQGSQLAGLEATEGPSAAQAQLNAATSRGLGDALTMARSGRGLGGSAAASAAAAGQAVPTMAANAANQSATLRANEQALWRQRQAANLANAGQIQLGAANQLGGQSEAQLNAALQSRAQNDAAQANLYGAGLGTMQGAAGNLNNAYNAALTASGQNINAQTAAGQLSNQAQQTGLNATQNAYNVGANGVAQNMAGVEAGFNAGNQGGQTQLAGMQSAYNAGAGGQTLGLQVEQAALGARQQQQANMLQEYGIRNDVAINDSNRLTNMIGAGVGAAATAGAMMSDERNKVKLSSPITGNPYGRTGAPGSDFAADASGPEDPTDLTPYGHAGRGAFDTAQRQAVEGPAKAEAEQQKRLSAAISAAGNAIRSGMSSQSPMRSHGGPVRPQYQPVQFGAPMAPVVSDERSKDRIAELEAQLAEFRGATGGPPATAGVPKRDIDTQALDLAQQRGAPDFSQSPNYPYMYKDPTMPGAAPGVQYGPMAQDLEKAGSSAVMDTPQGKMVDPGRIAMETAGAVGETQARQDDIERQFEELRAMMKPRRRSPGGRGLSASTQ